MIWVLGVAGGIVIFIAGLIAGNKLTVKGKYGKALHVAGQVMTQVDNAYDAVKPMLSQFPSASIVGAIFDWARRAVEAVEQMYIASEQKMSSDEKKQAAENFVCSALKTSGIDVTVEIKTVVNGAIESCVACQTRQVKGTEKQQA